MYIDDLTSRVEHSTVFLYADDVQLLVETTENNLDVSVGLMNSDLHNISEWSKANCLSLNPAKSQTICFGLAQGLVAPPVWINGQTICLFDSVRSLGFFLSSDFRMMTHIGNICSKVYATLRRLYMVKSYLPRYVRYKLIISLILPLFTYCAEIYSGCAEGELHRLVVCFNDCARFVYDKRRGESISKFTRSLLGCSLPVYYKYRNLLLTFKLLNIQIPRLLFTLFQYGQSSRSRSLIYPVCRTNIMHNSFVFRSSKLWNSVPLSCKNLVKLGEFKTAVRDFLAISRPSLYVNGSTN